MRTNGVTNFQQSVGAPPATPVAGDTYFDTTAKIAYVYDGAAWTPIAPGASSSFQMDSGWHYFDAPGEPVFNGNYYNNAGNAWPIARFRRAKDGSVFFELMPTGLTPGATTIFTMPPGFRPSATIYLPAATSGGLGCLTIQPNGIANLSWAPSHTWSNFAPCTYMAEDIPTPPNWIVPATLGGGWTNGNPPGTGLRYCIDSAGDYHFSGYIKGGNTGVANPIINIPELADGQAHSFLTVNGVTGAATRIDVGTTGDIYVQSYYGSGTNAMVSFDGMVVANPNGHWLAPALANSWIAYGGTYPTFQNCINKNGIISCRGLVKNGTATANTLMVAASGMIYPPRSQVILMTIANAGYARVDPMQSGGVSFQQFFAGGVNSFVGIYGRWLWD